MDITDKTKALRSEAWQAVLATPAYRAFKGLDDAVKAMTGEAFEPKPHFNGLGDALGGHGAARIRVSKRITQADIAERVLKACGEPLPIGRWLEKCIKDGIGVKGDDPLPNFRSTASRDKRFYNFTRNNMYFWWLKGVELPEGWKAAMDPDLPGLSVAADSNNQEGGDGHAANNTNLAS